MKSFQPLTNSHLFFDSTEFVTGVDLTQELMIID
jgi:hypothetical protein